MNEPNPFAGLPERLQSFAGRSDMSGRILSGEYLAARGAAYDAKVFLDPIVADFVDGDETLDAR